MRCVYISVCVCVGFTVGEIIEVLLLGRSAFAVYRQCNRVMAEVRSHGTRKTQRIALH